MNDFETIKNIISKVYNDTEVEIDTTADEEDIIFVGITKDGSYAFSLDFDKEGNFVGYTI